MNQIIQNIAIMAKDVLKKGAKVIIVTVIIVALLGSFVGGIMALIRNFNKDQFFYACAGNIPGVGYGDNRQVSFIIAPEKPTDCGTKPVVKIIIGS